MAYERNNQGSRQGERSRFVRDDAPRSRYGSSSGQRSDERRGSDGYGRSSERGYGRDYGRDSGRDDRGYGRSEGNGYSRDDRGYSRSSDDRYGSRSESRDSRFGNRSDSRSGGYSRDGYSSGGYNRDRGNSGGYTGSGGYTNGYSNGAQRRNAPVKPTDPNEPMRLSKRMSELGLSSRREADEWIERGWVLVNGKRAELGQKVVAADKIEIDRRASEKQSELVTILINKPVGYVSGQAEDGYEPARVLVDEEGHWEGDTSPRRFHHSQLRSLVPAGRLDIDSVGLLVLTQDGRVAKRIIGETSDVDKEYIVRVSNEDGSVPPRLSEKGLALLNHGLELDGKALIPAKVEWMNEDELRFVLQEGKKRQIRRMCELVGLKVTRLKRVRVGGVSLGALPLGMWRYLGENEKF